MGKLPIVSGREARRAFEKAGWVFDRQRGSHMVLRKPCEGLAITIPNHSELDRGTLRAILSDAGLTVDEFVALL